MKDELDVFVRESLARGVPRERITAALEDAGWPRKDIDAALGAWADTDFGVPVPKRRVGLAARETFLQLVLFATLYFVAYNVGAVLFAAIERWIPDRAIPRWASYLGMIRWGTAYILIGLPVHLWVSRIAARAGAGGDGQPSPVDRWLTYLTVFVAALTLIGSFVVVVSGLLGGELTARFLLKTFVVVCIAGVIFGHHLGRMKRQETERDGAPRPASWAARIGVVVAALTAVLGLWLSGTPGTARQQQLDAQRVEDLHRIQNAVERYYETNGEVPAGIQDLDTMPVGLRSDELSDPESGEPYAYTRIVSVRYELCATFKKPSPRPRPGERRPSPAGDVFWEHPAGRHCFELKVPLHRRPTVP
jgi:hypothetical protein